MKRYRGVYNVKFTNGVERTIEHIVLADDVETANKKLTIEVNGSYKGYVKVESFGIVSLVEDKAVKPSASFIRDCLLKLNDKNVSTECRRDIHSKLYAAFYDYTPNYDDDELSDILSYCEEGVLLERCKRIEEYAKVEDGLAYIVDGFLEELDAEWTCYYNPEKTLEEQYLKAISKENIYE